MIVKRGYHKPFSSYKKCVWAESRDGARNTANKGKILLLRHVVIFQNHEVNYTRWFIFVLSSAGILHDSGSQEGTWNHLFIYRGLPVWNVLFIFMEVWFNCIFSHSSRLEFGVLQNVLTFLETIFYLQVNSHYLELARDEEVSSK